MQAQALASQNLFNTQLQQHQCVTFPKKVTHNKGLCIFEHKNGRCFHRYADKSRY